MLDFSISKLNSISASPPSSFSVSTRAAETFAPLNASISMLRPMPQVGTGWHQSQP